MLGFWDYLLILLVTAQSALLAYTYHPQAKGFIMMLPIPFTLASMTLNIPVSVHNLAGLPLIMFFLAVVYVLFHKFRAPILLAIAAAVIAYCFIARLLVHLMPTDRPWLFWAVWTFDFCCGLALFAVMGRKHEPGHRTPLPLYLKLPCIMLIILGLVLIKHWLGGFMTAFPMVTTVAAYEARKSLWTVSRQMAMMIPLLAVMIAFIFIAEDYFHLALPVALLIGWMGYLLTMAAFNAIFPHCFLPPRTLELDPGSQT